MPKTNRRSTFNVRRLNHSPLSILVRLSIAVLLLAGGGCTLAKVDVNVVSERTSLENQVLGTYNALSEDVLLVASVRGVSPTGKVETPPKHSPNSRRPRRRWRTSPSTPTMSMH
ncbi:hypothetical protein [Geomonas subterranea]|uniref:hypothetical protein n=1 Tax=Geomonas subterranea TaxID=2847989 RepID=UPI001EF014E3|nr:hypothetical protein [Geomonas subterranea]